MTEALFPLVDTPVVSVAYSYETDWFSDLSPEEFDAARIALKAELARIRPPQTTLPLKAESGLLSETLLRVNTETTAALEIGLELLNHSVPSNQFLIQTSARRHLCLETVDREGNTIHINTMFSRLYLSSGDATKFPEPVSHVIQVGDKPARAVPLYMRIEWKCKS
ncbi:MAG: hypothetical protein ACJA0P_000471 [Planctomycetota bacterium]|jgi:hypothetical protein